MTSRTRLRLGTRASALAQWQANWVARRLNESYVDVELVPITTEGDVQTGPLGQIGGQGLFTKQIQQALLNHEIDVAVHSLKDLPTEPVDGLCLAAVPPRESACDVLVSNKVNRLLDLPEGACVGTGSMRRQAQLLHLRSDLHVQNIRGNVDTRLRKLDDAQFDAIILAEAGLRRLGLDHRITQVIPPTQMFPAVGQGALAVEARGGDEATLSIVSRLDDRAARGAVVAERTMLATLRGGCLAPVGAWGRVEAGLLQLDAVVLSADGHSRILASASGRPEEAICVGEMVANRLLEQGAGHLIQAARRSV